MATVRKDKKKGTATEMNHFGSHMLPNQYEEEVYR